jgi:tRNA A64-2'-O-ribosylphosphate transferase
MGHSFCFLLSGSFSLKFSNRIILVDSTRAGKRLPDALSKTIPIWCAVINRAVLLRFPEIGLGGWDVNLHTPPTSVSIQEYAQIETQLDGWAESLVVRVKRLRLLASTHCVSQNSSYDIPRLTRPLRPLWITPSNSTFPNIGQNFLSVICVSASEQVTDGIERRLGFSYVQGSGDDHELWGMVTNPSAV